MRGELKGGEGNEYLKKATVFLCFKLDKVLKRDEITEYCSL